MQKCFNADRLSSSHSILGIRITRVPNPLATGCWCTGWLWGNHPLYFSAPGLWEHQQLLDPPSEFLECLQQRQQKGHIHSVSEAHPGPVSLDGVLLFRSATAPIWRGYYPQMQWCAAGRFSGPSGFCSHTPPPGWCTVEDNSPLFLSRTP